MKYVIADKDCTFYKTIGGYCTDMADAVKYDSYDIAIRNCRLFNGSRVLTLKKRHWNDSYLFAIKKLMLRGLIASC